MRYQFKSNLLYRNQYKIYNYLQTISKDFHWQNQRAMLYEEYPDLVMSFIDCLDNGFINNRKFFFNYVNSLSVLGVIIGKRRHGKTCFMSWLAEQYHKRGRYIAVINFSDKAPSWMHIHKYDPESPYSDIPNDAVIFHDEIHKDIDAKNFNSKKNDNFRGFLSISAQKGITVYATSQVASNIPLDLMRMAEILVFKPMNAISGDKDRADFLRPFTLFYPNNKEDVLAVLQDRLLFFNNPIPDFYTKEMSEAFK